MVELRDSANEVVGATAQGVYEVEAGTYTYTVSKEGFITETDGIVVIDEDIVVNVTLEEVIEEEVETEPEP